MELFGDAGDPPARVHVLAVLAWSLVLRGKARKARLMLDEVERLAATIDPLSLSRPSVLIGLNARLPTGEFERAQAESLAICERAREAGAVGALPIPPFVAGASLPSSN